MVYRFKGSPLSITFIQKGIAREGCKLAHQLQAQARGSRLTGWQQGRGLVAQVVRALH